MKNKVIVLTGPTAVGKTSLSIELAKRINGEIISADSMQVYKYMDIGSAKIKKEDMQGIKHYLIDEIEPNEDFNVFTFKNMAQKAINEIYNKNKIPIIVGGTGFYIQALLYDIKFDNEDNSIIRKELEEEALKIGSDNMYEQLKAIDPEYAKTLHPNNLKKIIRAIEFIKLNGTLYSEHNKNERQKDSPYSFKYYVLNDIRENLYQNIDKRVDIMFNEGLEAEVYSLYSKGYNKSYNSMQGLGYKELIDYFDQKCSLEEAKEKIKLETRHFAKRQLTWFRRERDVIWVNKNEFNYDEEAILEYIINDIKELDRK